MGIFRSLYEITKGTAQIAEKSLEALSDGAEELHNFISEHRKEYERREPIRRFERDIARHHRYIATEKICAELCNEYEVLKEEESLDYEKEYKEIQQTLLCSDRKIKKIAHIFYGDAVLGMSVEEIEQYHNNHKDIY